MQPEEAQILETTTEQDPKSKTLSTLSKISQKTLNSGIIYLSKIPPFMKPSVLKQILSTHGPINRIYLSQEASSIHKKRVKYKGNKRINYTEGWVEFTSKKTAKYVAGLLNGNILGGKKKSFYHDDIWNMKYLPGFKWNDLTSQIALEKNSRDQRERMEMRQVKLETVQYRKQVGVGKMLDKMAEKGKVLKGDRVFRQRKVVENGAVKEVV